MFQGPGGARGVGVAVKQEGGEGGAISCLIEVV